MLRLRVITSIVLSLVGLGATFFLSPPVFTGLAAAVLLGLGGWEGARLGGVDHPVGRVIFGLGLLIFGSALYLVREPGEILIYLLPGCVLWLGLLAWLSQPQLGQAPTVAHRTAKLAVMAVVLLTAWLALSWIQAGSPWHVLLLLIIISSADVGAYFTGRRVGGPKLAPTISPGKTRSGALGGLVCAMLLTAAAAAILPDGPFSPWLAGSLAGALALVSMGGDLYISLLKRHRQLKDTSRLLPGHGGILDRFDSLGAALPFFALAIALWAR